MSTIKFIRKELLGVSQSHMAVIAETNQATVSRWENGDSSPNLEQLGKIRAAVKAAGKDWKDEWFFQSPEAAA
ncbi:helix-turn-helix domain-containing protein [Nitratireductor basaltis]|uniref:Transcriptional regulator, XRE family n=1 Tax=Nitratireductor basaltis TaxID=472175 RepID=A0A084UBM9_9HYPH|nr:helix-turn-helix transcriptional regulator [Nitratireductor basaltis]KFB10365.1 Transcriptional regulator, XRE family [Nitratireductor basaltis]